MSWAGETMGSLKVEEGIRRRGSIGWFGEEEWKRKGGRSRVEKKS